VLTLQDLGQGLYSPWLAETFGSSDKLLRLSFFPRWAVKEVVLQHTHQSTLTLARISASLHSCGYSKWDNLFYT